MWYVILVVIGIVICAIGFMAAAAWLLITQSDLDIDTELDSVGDETRRGR